MSENKKTKLPWSIGRTLLTTNTKRWSDEEFEKNDLTENRMIFSNFSPIDGGKSRVFVGACENPDDAKFIVKAVNSYQILLDALIAIRDFDDMESEYDDPGHIAIEALKKVNP